MSRSIERQREEEVAGVEEEEFFFETTASGLIFNQSTPDTSRHSPAVPLLQKTPQGKKKTRTRPWELPQLHFRRLP